MTDTHGKPRPEDPLGKEVIQAFEEVNGGPHPGYRPAHAKGILLSGEFLPTAAASQLSKASHFSRPSTKVDVRFSDFAGVPNVADNDGEHASPRGFALRFYLAEHVHTDIVAHSVDSFPARTVEELVEFLHAVRDSFAPGATKPLPIEKFLGTHPAALAFVQAPKPIPVSFATESFYSVSAYKFINADGAVKFGRYQIHPVAGGQFLDDAAVAKKGPNFLFDEIQERVKSSPVKFKVQLQVAAEGDVVDDSTVRWPADRPIIDLGTLTLTAVVPNNAEEQRRIIFDPVPRVDGIEPSGDPLTDPRATVYVTSGRRRRAAGTAASA